MNEHGDRLASLQSRRRGPFDGYIYEQVVRASDVFGPPTCVVVRHEPIMQHRLRFNERIVIGPDWDFFTRYSAVATFGYLNDRTCLYRVHGSNITASVTHPKRLEYLAACRENAIKMDKFGTCSAETRADVFYDLLVNLLAGQPAKQRAATEWNAFRELPDAQQARLLRLTAAEAILHDAKQPAVTAWLDRARMLNPADLKATFLAALHAFSPRVCHAVLRARSLGRRQMPPSPPFADLLGVSGRARPAGSPTIT
jgi:hypothetical protein